MKHPFSRSAIVLASLLVLCGSALAEVAPSQKEIASVKGTSFLQTSASIKKSEDEELLAAEDSVAKALLGDDDDEVSKSSFNSVDHLKDPAYDPLFLAQGHKPQVVEWLTINADTPIEMANVIIARKNIEQAKIEEKIQKEKSMAEKSMHAKEVALQKYAADKVLLETSEKAVADAKRQVENYKMDVAKYSEILDRRRAALAKVKREQSDHSRELTKLQDALNEAETNYKLSQKLHDDMIADEAKLKESVVKFEMDIRSRTADRRQEFAAFKIQALDEMEPKIKYKEEEIGAVVSRLRSNIENLAQALLRQQQDLAKDEDIALKANLKSFKDTIGKLEQDYMTSMQELTDMMTLLLEVRKTDLDKYKMDAPKLLSVISESNARLAKLKEQMRMKTENMNVIKTQALDAYLQRKSKIQAMFAEQLNKVKDAANSRISERAKQIDDAQSELSAFVNAVSAQTNQRIAEAEQRVLLGSEDEQSQMAELQGKATAASNAVENHVEPNNKLYQAFLDAARLFGEAKLMQHEALIKVRENEVGEAKTKVEEYVQKAKEAEFEVRRMEAEEKKASETVDEDMRLIRQYDSVAKDHQATAESLEHINIPKVVEKQVREEWKWKTAEEIKQEALQAEAVQAAVEAAADAVTATAPPILENTAIGVEKLGEEYMVTVNETPEGPVVVMSTEEGPVVIDAQPQGPIITEQTSAGPVVVEEMVYGAEVIASPVLAPKDVVEHAVQKALHDMPPPENVAEAKADLVFQATHGHGEGGSGSLPSKEAIAGYEKFFVRGGLENTAHTILRPWHKQVQHETDWEHAHPIYATEAPADH